MKTTRNSQEAALPQTPQFKAASASYQRISELGSWRGGGRPSNYELAPHQKSEPSLPLQRHPNLSQKTWEMTEFGVSVLRGPQGFTVHPTRCPPPRSHEATPVEPGAVWAQGLGRCNRDSFNFRF